MKPKREVKIQLKLCLNAEGKWEIYLQNRQRAIDEAVRMFAGNAENVTEIQLEGVIKKPSSRKSSKKLAYLFAEIIPRITDGLIEAGWHGMTEDVAYLWLCKRFNGTKVIVNQKTGETEEDIITLSDMDDEQTGTFMNAVVMFGSTELGLRFQSPDEYRQQQQNFDSSVDNLPR